jgi:hypothetical protein
MIGHSACACGVEWNTSRVPFPMTMWIANRSDLDFATSIHAMVIPASL